MGIVSAYYKLKEHLKINKFRLNEELNRHRIFFELLKRRQKSLFALVILVLISFFADTAFTYWLLPIIVNQPWYNVLIAYVGFPSIDTIIGLLSAIISGVAAVIGLLLTISLVVLELAANRYPYSMVRFLLEEKVGAYVIDFLIVSFLFSAWTLFLIQRGPTLPVISITAALLMASLSIVFVFVYRDYSLYFFRPKQGFEAVALEARRSIHHVFEKGRNLGLPVTTYLQKRTHESVQVMTDFIDVLSQKKDPDSWYGNINLSSILSLYVTGKRFIDVQSGWFPSISVPASTEGGLFYTGLDEPFEELALGERTVSKPDTEWLERQILSSLKNAQMKAIENNDISCLASFALGYKNIIETCFDHQEFTILDLTLSAVKDFADQISTVEQLEATSEFYNIMLLLTEKAIHGFDLPKLHEVLGKISWYSDDEILLHRLPRVFTEEFLSFRKKIETEIIVEKRIITPREWIDKEIMERILKADQEFSRKYYDVAFRILAKMFTKVISSTMYREVRNVVVVELLSIRRAVVLNKNKLSIKNIDSAVEHSLKAYAALKEKKAFRHDVFSELKLGCLNSIKCRDSTSFGKFYDTLAQVTLKELGPDNDFFPQEALESLMVVSSLAFLYSEFYSDNRVFDTVVDSLSRYYDINKLTKFFDALLTGYNVNLTLKYHHWFRGVFLEINKLPTIAQKHPPARSLSFVYDHASAFIRESSHMIGVDECAKGMIKQLKERSKAK